MAKCSCEGGTKVVLPCSGASNVGQIANEAAKRLDVEGAAGFFCTAGVGGHISGMVASVKGADKVLVLDGCSVACAKKCVDEAGIKDYDYLVVTDLGIEKKHEFNLSEADIENTVSECRLKLRASGAQRSAGCCG